jgi:histidinol-phosphate/aromatic aminotransferase/cobyric acid decarboxylase-like protein/GNAT superfamily N-acetyltransferase
MGADAYLLSHAEERPMPMISTMHDVSAPASQRVPSVMHRPVLAPYEIAHAAGTDREQIHRMRHRVYATELGQHPENADGRLEDALDGANDYLVARHDGRVVGFISITPPNDRGYSIDKYLSAAELPVPRDAGLYELRLLTVDPAHRRTQVAMMLMYAGFRWVSSRGASHVVVLGRTGGTVDLYTKMAFRGTRRRFPSGSVEYELMTASIEAIRARVAESSELTTRLRRSCRWSLDIPFDEPAGCYHGGASFGAIGDGMTSLDRARDVISADVLDAWYPPAPAVVDAVHAHLPFVLRTSPPADCAGLLRAIATARGVPIGSLVPGGGSSDLIFRAFLRWLSPTSRVLLLDPTYGEYAHVTERVVGCQVDRVALDRASGYAVDVETLRARMQGGYDLIVIVNPNSPTGQHLPSVVLREVLASVPASTRVWIDEAYLDYCGRGTSLESYAAASTNTIVCKSMSKVYALSGVRAAYLCAPPAIAASLRAITPPWVVSLPAQVAGIHALAATDYYAARYAQTHELRAELASALRTIDAIDEVMDGVANFLLCHLSSDAPSAEVLCAQCRDHGLFLRELRSMSARDFPGAFRIAVKDRETNARMVAIIRAVLGG